MKNKKFFKVFSILVVLCVAMSVGMAVRAEVVPAHDVNMVANGEFDDSTNGWTTAAPVGGSVTPTIVNDVATWGGNGNAVKLSITPDSTPYWNETKFQQTPFAVSKDVVYKVSFKAKADSNGRTIRALFQNNTSPYTSDLDTSTINLTNTVQTYSYSFTASASSTYALRFYFGANSVGTELYLDQISFSTALGIKNNILKDGAFDTTTTFSTGSNWVLANKSTAVSTASVISDSQFLEGKTVKIAISTLGATWSDIQLVQNNCSIVLGKTYTFTFDARADSARTMALVLQQNTTPYTQYFKQDFSLTTSKTTYMYSWVSTATDTNSALRLSVGHSTTGVYIDNVKMMVTPDPIALASSTPANNAVDVANNSNLKFNFNNELDDTTLTSGNVSVTGGNSTIQSILKNADNKSFTVNFAENLEFDTDYTVSLTGIKDIFGQTLADQQINFLTAKAYVLNSAVFKKVIGETETVISVVEPGTLKCYVSLNNNYTSAKPISMVLALYKVFDNGASLQLVSGSVYEGTLAVGANSINQQIIVPDDGQSYRIKMLTWNSLDGMSPLISVRELN